MTMKTFTLSLALLLCAVAQLHAAERGSLEGIAAWKDDLAAIQTIESEWSSETVQLVGNPPKTRTINNHAWVSGDKFRLEQTDMGTEGKLVSRRLDIYDGNVTYSLTSPSQKLIKKTGRISHSMADSEVVPQFKPLSFFLYATGQKYETPLVPSSTATILTECASLDGKSLTVKPMFIEMKDPVKREAADGITNILTSKLEFSKLSPWPTSAETTKVNDGPRIFGNVTCGGFKKVTSATKRDFQLPTQITTTFFSKELPSGKYSIVIKVIDTKVNFPMDDAIFVPDMLAVEPENIMDLDAKEKISTPTTTTSSSSSTSR